ncbi:RNA-binding protein 48 [Bradysia coprophila]|uniref:RNA-binding protein 48 n=1 Tax=Bradysia coprophila TaxID=38358 RepID=UPI00187DC212|nr:RNA-binding protein 48 [Bradysia coprophila]
MSGEEQPSSYHHHQRYKLCTNRPKYRASRRLTAVKVYTVANESRHLLVFGVPKINLKNEVRREFQKFGTVESADNVTEELLKKGIDIEKFTDCFKVTFEKIENARRSKKFTDDKNFYGGILHVSYAPEYESIDDIRKKFKQRQEEVKFRMKINKKSGEKS